MINLIHEGAALPRRTASYLLRRQLLARVVITLIDLRFRRSQIPLRLVCGMRRLFHASNVFEPHPSVYVCPGSRLNNRVLSRRLAPMEMGMWTLGVDTLNYIESLIKVEKPGAILEFGSGLSTLCLCQYMHDLHGGSGHPRVFSIEQEGRYVSESSKMISEFGFENLVRIAHRPLTAMRIEGIETECYDISHRFLVQFLGDSAPAFVLVDGPAGGEGIRFGTLPLVKDFVQPGARFVLDDALRDSEIKTARMWDRLPYLRIFGIKTISKGVLTGEVFHRYTNR